MNISDITCSDFKPTQTDGRTRCIHFLPSGGCDLHDRCHEFLKAKGLADKKTYSNSRLTRLGCRRAYWYSYIEGIQAITSPLYMRRGALIHRALAWLYRGKPWNQFRIYEQELNVADEKEAVEAMKLSAVYEAYVRIVDLGEWKYTIADVEKFVQGQIAGREFIAYLDLYPLHNNKRIIVDHKLVGDLEDFSLLSNRDQVCMYLHLNPEVEAFCFNLLARPWRMRPKKGEELEEFRKRTLTEVLAYPKKYFDRKYFYRAEFDIQTWLKETEIKLEELEGLPKEIEFFFRDTNNCRILECEFEPICETGVIDWNLFKKKGVKR